MKTPALDDPRSATEPEIISLSHTKLRRLHPRLYANHGVWRLVRPIQQLLVARQEERLFMGDCRAAIVLSTEPLLIAAYTDELDCVAMLSFPQRLVREHGLHVGTRLLAVNVYWSGPRLTELRPGPESLRRFSNFAPLIAEFVSDDITEIEARKSEIEDREWLRATELGAAHLRERRPCYRDGRPLNCGRPPWLKPTAPGKVGGLIGMVIALLLFLKFGYPFNLSLDARAANPYRIVLSPIAAVIGWVLGQSLGNAALHRPGREK